VVLEVVAVLEATAAQAVAVRVVTEHLPQSLSLLEHLIPLQ
jgi:hypothetical protein